MTLTAPAAVLALRPNWATPVRVSYAWKTSVVRLDCGAERRAILKTCPDRRLSFNLTLLTAADARFFNRFLYQNQHQVIGVPVWPGGTRLTAEAAEDDESLTVEFVTFSEFYAGDWCLLLSPTGNPALSAAYELAEVASANMTTITLAAPLAATWPAGTEVYPVLSCRLPRALSAGCTTRTALSVTLDLEEAGINADKALTAFNADLYGTLYRGASIFDYPEPNWVTEPKIDHLRTLSVFAGLGKDLAETNELEPRRRFSATYTFTEREYELAPTVEFFFSRRGRARGFWMPTFTNDLTVTAAIGAGDTHLHVHADADYAASWLPNATQGRFLFLQWPDGDTACLKVNSVTGGTQLNLDAAVGKACAADKLNRLRVSFLNYVRFDHDDLVISYNTPEVGDIELGMISLIGENS